MSADSRVWGVTPEECDESVDGWRSKNEDAPYLVSVRFAVSIVRWRKRGFPAGWNVFGSPKGVVQKVSGHKTNQ